MNLKRISLLLTIALIMGFFHQCNQDGNEDLTPILSKPLFKQVEISKDENLVSALRQVFVSNNPAARSFSLNLHLSSDSAVVGRDLKRNLVHYSLPLFDEKDPMSSTLQNLVITVTSDRKAYANIFSYVPEDNKGFTGMESFTGDFIISDIEGNEVGRSYFVDGKLRNGSSSDSRVQVIYCVTTHYYTTVSAGGTTTTKLQYIESECIDYGSSAGSITEAERQQLGGGTGGVPINTSTYSSSIPIDRVCPNSFKYVQVGSGSYTTQVNNINDKYLVPDTGTGYLREVIMRIPYLCIEIGNRNRDGKLLSRDAAADITAFGWNKARDSVWNQLKYGRITESQIQDTFIAAFKSWVGYEVGRTPTVTRGTCRGGVPSQNIQYSYMMICW